MNEFDKNKLDELLKKERQRELTEEEKTLISQSKDEVYKNVMKNVHKSFFMAFLAIVAYKVWEKFSGSTLFFKIMTVAVATTTVTVGPYVAKKIIDIHKEEAKKKVIIEYKETKKHIIKNQHEQPVIAFNSVLVQSKTLPDNQLAEFKKVIYQYLYAKSQKNYQLSVAIDKNKYTGKYYVSFSLKDKNTSGGLKDVSHELNSYNEALDVCRKISQEIYSKHIK